jgi:hypothetical protein
MNRSELISEVFERMLGTALRVAEIMHLGKDYLSNLLNNLVERLECTRFAW